MTDIATDPAKEARRLCERLTPAQRQVVVLACQGYQSAQIAAHMGVTDMSVYEQRKAVLSKWKVPNMVAAAVIATRAGLV